MRSRRWETGGPRRLLQAIVAPKAAPARGARPHSRPVALDRTGEASGSAVQAGARGSPSPLCYPPGTPRGGGSHCFGQPGTPGGALLQSPRAAAFCEQRCQTQTHPRRHPGATVAAVSALCASGNRSQSSGTATRQLQHREPPKPSASTCCSGSAGTPSWRARWGIGTPVNPARLLRLPTREPLPNRAPVWAAQAGLCQGDTGRLEAQVWEQPQGRLQVRAFQNEDISGWQKTCTRQRASD